MNPFSAGQIMGGSDGCVHVKIYGAPHYICPEELGMLFFVGDSVPLLKNFPSVSETPQLSGRVHLNASGRSVIIEIGAARFMVPRDRFLAVAFGEDISCLIFEIPSDKNEIEIISPRKGGKA
ncbi:MAG: hypothetical protein Q7T80_14990 [Methanoregula sp.]|nr:hypothetical protein [Methanoregula sp.]